MNELRYVSEREFDEFIRDYPKKLHADTIRFCDPPLLTYNDFERGEGLDQIVASVKLDRDTGLRMPGTYQILGESA